MRIKATGMLFILLPVLAFAFVQDLEKEEIRQRIAPLGTVNVTGDAAPQAAPAVAATPAAKVDVGEATYKNFCVVCHAAGVAGAPKAHNAGDWAPRMKKGLDGLVASATKGINAMPPKGTCVDCTDADLKAAIVFMTK